MPLFVNLPAPHLVVCSPTISGGTAAITAGAAFFNGFELYGTTTFTSMRTVIGGAPTGNVDMGIYDATGTNGAPGNLLAHTGAILSAAGQFTKSLTSNLTIGPGRYWLALLDTVGDTFEFIIPGQGLGLGMGAYWRSSATGLTVLPTTSGAVTQVANCYGVEALVLNSYS